MNKGESRIDMSPAALDRRLRDLSELWEFGMTIKNAKRLGKVRDKEPHSTKASAGSRSPEPEAGAHRGALSPPARGR